MLNSDQNRSIFETFKLVQTHSNLPKVWHWNVLTPIHRWHMLWKWCTFLKCIIELKTIGNWSRANLISFWRYLSTEMTKFKNCLGLTIENNSFPTEQMRCTPQGTHTRWKEHRNMQGRARWKGWANIKYWSWLF